MQTNFIDCMELRSAEIRSHIVIRRIYRVCSLCVFRLLQHRHPGWDRMMSTSAPPSSFTVAPLHQIIPHHMLYSNPRYMFYSNPRYMFYSNPRHMLHSNPRHILHSNPRHIFLLESIINHIHKKSAMSGNRHTILTAYKCHITSPGIPD